MKRLSLIFAGLSLSTAVFAGAADQIVVQEPYVRLAPPNAPATGAFMVIRNTGSSDVKVLKADNPASRVTELHTHTNENGVMKMRPVPAIDVPAKGQAVLQPGGLHVMLIDMKAPLNGIASMIDFVVEDYADRLDDDGRALRDGRGHVMGQAIEGQDRGAVRDRLRVTPRAKAVAEREHIRIRAHTRIPKQIPCPTRGFTPLKYCKRLPRTVHPHPSPSPDARKPGSYYKHIKMLHGG